MSGGIDVKQIAKIARIKLDESSVTTFQNRLETVVNWVSEAKAVDVAGFEPMIDINQDLANTTHNSDQNPVIKAEKPADLLQNAKGGGEDGNCFTTILVVE